MSDKPKFHDLQTVEVEQSLGEILGDLRAEMQSINTKLGWMLFLFVVVTFISGLVHLFGKAVP